MIETDTHATLHERLRLKRTVAVPIILSLATLSLTACAEAVPSEPCAVYGLDGKQLKPKEYPLGVVDVIYYARNDYNNYGNRETPQGVISYNDGQYILDVKDVPNKKSILPGSGDSNDAIFIKTPETGEIGFTTGCMSTGIDSSGLPTTFVNLPTY